MGVLLLGTRENLEKIALDVLSTSKESTFLPELPGAV